MNDDRRKVARREAARRIATLALALPAVLANAPAGAGSEKPELDPRSDAAQKLGYAHDGGQTARPSVDQHCARCTHFTPVGDGAWGRCNVFPENRVNAEGWCSAFYPRG